MSYRNGSKTPTRVTTDLLAKVEASQKTLNCFITVLGDSALEQARAAETRLAEGRPIGPLDGVPVALKDLIYIKGVRCTAGSTILSGNVAEYDSPVAARLKAAGAVLIGTTNMHEFAAGITGENPHFGPVRNPWDLERIAGGSSSGSAAAVAAGLLGAAIGTDTAGSVRVPAALCGVLGMKPTYGRISRLGVIPLASSFDTVGTLTSCAWDAAALLGTLAGHQAEDLTTVAADVPDYLSELQVETPRLRAGVPRKFLGGRLDGALETVFEGFLDRLTGLGFTVQNIEAPELDQTESCWRTIRYAEATAFHMRWLESSPSSYGEDVRASLEAGRGISAVDYVNAQNLRPSLMNGLLASMKDVDLMALPTTSITAPEIGQKTVEVRGRETDVRSALIGLTVPMSTVGFPALSVPAGLAGGLPVGVQLAAGPFEEAKLLRAAAALERGGHYPAPHGIV